MNFNSSCFVYDNGFFFSANLESYCFCVIRTPCPTELGLQDTLFYYVLKKNVQHCMTITSLDDNISTAGRVHGALSFGRAVDLSCACMYINTWLIYGAHQTRCVTHSTQTCMHNHISLFFHRRKAATRALSLALISAGRQTKLAQFQHTGVA